jgi:hypothetical protein
MLSSNTGIYSTKTGSSSIVKTFPPSTNFDIWKYTARSDSYPHYITPSQANTNVYIPNDLIVNGTLVVDGTIIPSDIRIKDNIVNIDQENANMILQLNPKQYTLKKEGKNGKNHYGFIAQEVETLFPHLITETIYNAVEATDCNFETIKAVNYLEMIPLLLLKIQDLQKQIDDMNKKQRMD